MSDTLNMNTTPNADTGQDFEDILVEIAPNEADTQPAAAEVAPEPKRAEPAVQKEEAPPAPKPKYTDADYEATQRVLQDVRARNESLEKARDEERQSRAKAEEDAHKFREAAWKAHHATVAARYDHITDSIKHWETTADVAKRNLQLATESGNAADIADWTRALARAENTLTTLASTQPTIEAELREAERYVQTVAQIPKPELKREDDAPKKGPLTPDEWIEGVRGKVGDKLADWFKANREFVSNPKLHEKAMKFADAYQVLEERPLNSDDFISAMNEKFLGKKAQTKQEPAVTEDDTTETEVETPQPQPAKRTTAVAAPVTRGKPAQPSSSATRITLTQDQFAIAPELYPSYNDLDPETQRKFPSWSENAARYQYDRDLKRAKADGKFNRG